MPSPDITIRQYCDTGTVPTTFLQHSRAARRPKTASVDRLCHYCIRGRTRNSVWSLKKSLIQLVNPMRSDSSEMQIRGSKITVWCHYPPLFPCATVVLGAIKPCKRCRDDKRITNEEQLRSSRRRAPSDGTQKTCVHWRYRKFLSLCWVYQLHASCLAIYHVHRGLRQGSMRCKETGHEYIAPFDT